MVKKREVAGNVSKIMGHEFENSINVYDKKGYGQKEMCGCMFSACDGVSAEVNRIKYGRKSEMHIRKETI